MTFLSPRPHHWSRLTAAPMCLLFILATTPVAHTQGNRITQALKGTLCDAPQDEDTKTTCVAAVVQCGLASMAGRSDEERDRILRVCVDRTVKTRKRALNEAGAAIRREYGGETDAQVAADLAKKRSSGAHASSRTKPLEPITNPDWLHKPNGDDYVSYYPQQAAAQQKEGKVALQCTVTARGTLDYCTVQEDPPGWGFGDATLRISRLFKMALQTPDGQPVAGRKFSTVVAWRLGG